MELASPQIWTPDEEFDPVIEPGTEGFYRIEGYFIENAEQVRGDNNTPKDSASGIEGIFFVEQPRRLIMRQPWDIIAICHTALLLLLPDKPIIFIIEALKNVEFLKTVMISKDS